MLEQIFIKLLERKVNLEKDTLTRPPQDYAAFRENVGRYSEILFLLNEIENVIKGREDDE